MGAVTRLKALKPERKTAKAMLAIALLFAVGFSACEFFALAPHAALARRPDLLSPLSGGQQGGGALFFENPPGALGVTLSVEYHEFMGEPVSFSARVSGLENESSEIAYFIEMRGAQYEYNFTLTAGSALDSSVTLPSEAPAGVYLLSVTANAENKTGSTQKAFYYHEGNLVVDAALTKPEETPGEYAVAGSVSFAQQSVPFAEVNITITGSENGFYSTAGSDEGVFEQRFYASTQGDYEALVEASKNDYYGATRVVFSISQANATPTPSSNACPTPAACPQPSFEVVTLEPTPEPSVSLEASPETSSSPSPEAVPSPIAPNEFGCKKTGLNVTGLSVFSQQDESEVVVGDELSVYGVLEPFLDQNQKNYHVIVFWGDGSNSSELTLSDSEPPWAWTTESTGNHSYAAEGVYDINVVAFYGSLPGADCANESRSIRVNASEPTATPSLSPLPTPEYNANVEVASETTEQANAAVGKPVKWTKKIVLRERARDFVVALPPEAQNATLANADYAVPAYAVAPEAPALATATEAIANTTPETPASAAEATVEANSTEGVGAVAAAQIVQFAGAESVETETAQASQTLDWTDLSVSEVALENNAEKLVENGAENGAENATETGVKSAVRGAKGLRVRGGRGDFSELEVEYYTGAPQASEEQTGFGSKRVVVTAPMHYENVSVYASLPVEVNNLDDIELSWVLSASQNLSGLNLTDDELREISENGFLVKKLVFKATNGDSNGFVHEISWVIPELTDNQSFGINITILNVHSHPQLYGNWTVNFETNGAADLTITATRDLNYTENYTRWSDSSENETLYDLRFLEIRCGDRLVPYEWRGANCAENECSVVVPNYSCNETASENSKVLKARRHVLRFDFGGQSVFAYNDASNAHMILLFNNTLANVPSGWTCISCYATDPFYRKFIVPDATYGGSGGSDYHAHNYQAFLGTASAGTLSTVTTNTGAPATHAHKVMYTANTTASNFPPYYDFLVIRCNTSGLPATLPSGVIAFFNTTSLPANWTRFSAADGYYIRGNATAQVTGGSWTHTHTWNISWTTTSNATGLTSTTTASVANGVHTHEANTSASRTTTAIEAVPVTSKIIIAYLNDTRPVPNGMYALWNATPPVEWTSRSASSADDFYQKFLYATSAYGTLITTSNASHTHTALTDKTAASATAGVNYKASGATTNYSSATHYHAIYWTGINTTDMTPSYYSAIFASYANTAPNVSLSAPSNGTTSASANVNFTFTPIDNSGFKNCTTLLFYSNGTSLNQTNWNGTSSIANNTVNGINYTFAAEGIYLCNVECWDNGDVSLSNRSNVNYTVTVDTTAPASIVYVTPSPLNGSIQNYNYSYINVTFTEASPSACLLNYVYPNSTNVNLTMTLVVGTGGARYCYFNVTDQPAGYANFTVYVNDSQGRWGSNLSQYGFTIDKTAPSSIAYVTPTPLNGSFRNYAYAYINVTFTEANPSDSCIISYVYPNSTNVNLTAKASGTNCYFNVTTQGNGYANFTVYVNDTPGNLGSNLSQYGFTIDTTKPASIVYVTPSPANASFRNYNYSYVNVTFTEANPDSCLLNYVYSNSSSVNLTMTKVTGSSPYCYFNVSDQPAGYANFTVYVNDSAGNWGSNLSQYGFTIDKTAPASIVYVTPSPANASFRNYNYSYINATFTETNPDSCLLNYVYPNSTNVNLTMTKAAGAAAYCYFNVTTQGDGQANFTVYVNDTAGNWGSNVSTYKFYIDRTAPASIVYVSPTPSNNSLQNYNYSYVNASFTETNPDTCLLNYRYANSTNVNLTMTKAAGAAAYCYFNVTTQGDGQPNFTVYVNDSAGNWGSNVSTYSFRIDVTKPASIAYVSPSPSNNSYQSYAYAYINTTFTETNPDSCLLNYVYPNSTNVNLTMTKAAGAAAYCYKNVTTQGDGQPNFTVYVNDTAGNWGSNVTTYKFYVDTTAPASIAYVSPTPSNNSYQNYNYSYVNATFTESNPDSCLLNYVYPNSTNVNLTMTKAAGTGTYCYFNVTTQGDGQANFTVYVNDSAGNWGSNLSTYKFYIDMTKPVPAFVGPTPPDSNLTKNKYAYVNVSVTDLNPGAAFIDWNRSLVGYWAFSEGSGTTAFDNSSYGNNGALTNGPTYNSSGKFGYGLSFDNNDDFVNCLNASSLSITGNLTLEAWVYPADSGRGLVVGKVNGAGGDVEAYRIEIGSDGKPAMAVIEKNSPSYTRCDATSPTVLTANTWTHLVGVFNAGTGNVSIWVNGNLMNWTNYSDSVAGEVCNSIQSISDNVTIGRYEGAYSVTAFSGVIDEVRIWNRTLSEQEINASYNNGLYRLENNFTGLSDGNYSYYGFAVDAAGNQNKTETRAITIDTTAPTVSLGTNPVDNYNSSSSTVVFDSKCSDNVGLSTLQIWANDTGTWQVKATNSSRKKPINVSVSSGYTGTNYQVKLNVTYDSDMKSDFSDLRFYNGSENTQLDYWLENKSDGNWAIVWVEVDQNITTTNYTFYMYYGNAGASSASNITNTGVDGSTTWDDSTGWSLTLGSVSGGILTLDPNGTSAASAARTTTLGYDYALRSSVNWYNEGGSYLEQGFGWWNKGAGEVLYNSPTTGDYGATVIRYYGSPYNYYIRAFTNGANSQTQVTAFAGAYHVIEVRRNSTTVSHTLDDGSESVVTSNVPTGSYNLHHWYQKAGTGTQKIDWTFIRKFVSPEPTSGFGSEQSSGGLLNDTWWNASISGLTQATFIWGARCDDSAGNVAWSNNRTLTIISPPSSIAYVSPTPANNSWRNYNYSYVNATFTASNPDTCLLNYVYPNSTNVNLTMTKAAGVAAYCYFNVTTQGDGQANFTVYVNDSAGNWGSNLSQYGFTIDVTPPSNIVYVGPTPVNNSNLTQDYFYVNVTFTESNPDSCLLEINDSNYSATRVGTNCYYNATLTDSGDYVYRMWVNDSAGNWGVSEQQALTFTSLWNWVTPHAVYDKCGEEGDSPATNTIDNDTSTRWGHSAEEQHWIAYEYCTLYTHSKLQIYTAPDKDSNVCAVSEIYVSNDPANWGDSLGSCELIGSGLAWYNCSFTAATGKYLKILFDTRSGGGDCGDYGFKEFDEFQSFSKLADVTPPTPAFVDPTPPNNNLTNYDYAYVNVSVTDANPGGAFVDWNRSLIGYWSFEEGSGATAYDNSTWGNNGTLYPEGSENWTCAGRFGCGAQFDGNDDEIQVPNSDSLNSISSALSIDFWVKYPYRGSYGDEDLVYRAGDWDVRLNSERKIYFQVPDLPSQDVTGATALSNDTWYHVAAVFNSTYLSIYLNGVSDVSKETSGAISDSGDYMYFGKGDNWFTGALDEIRVWNRSLSEQEINASFNNSAYRLENNFTSLSDGVYDYYGFAVDQSGNQNKTETRNITIDKTAPASIIYVNPTPLNGSTQDYNYSYINVTFTETNPDTCLLNYVYPNSTNVNLTMTRSGTNCYFNVTSQPDGEANFTVYVNDTVGHWGSNLTYYYFTISHVEIIDMTINCSALNLGTGFTPGTANGTRSDTQQCQVTISSNTNVAVDLSLNGSDLSGAGGVLKVANITVSNNSGAVGSCLTELSPFFKSGACQIGTLVNYTNWVNIPKPVSAVYRDVFFFVNVPQNQLKKTYTGTIYVKAVKH